MFLACHVGFAVIAGLFAVRAVPSPWLFPWVCAANLAFGLVFAASSIAVTSELLALLPREDKSLAAAVFTALTRMGVAFGGILSAGMLKAGMLAESWTLGGVAMSRYDSLLVVFAAAVLLLVVTLGQVPAVMGGGRRSPGAR